MIKYIEATEKLKPLVKDGLVAMFPQGRQYGDEDKTKPVFFDLHRAAKNMTTGGWMPTPNIADESTAKTLIENAQIEFNDKMNEKDAEIEKLKKLLEISNEKQFQEPKSNTTIESEIELTKSKKTLKI